MWRILFFLQNEIVHGVNNSVGLLSESTTCQPMGDDEGGASVLHIKMEKKLISWVYSHKELYIRRTVAGLTHIRFIAFYERVQKLAAVFAYERFSLNKISLQSSLHPQNNTRFIFRICSSERISPLALVIYESEMSIQG